MSPERYQRIREVYFAIREQPAEKHAALLDELCAGDAELRASVKQLLAAEVEGTASLDLPLFEGKPSRDTAAQSRVPFTPDAFPGYSQVREIGRGGQGAVYQAIQKATKRKVAIKVLLEGSFAFPAVRRRFEREVELVAQLKHPHIVSVLHAGQASDGRQFYVMEFIRGTPLIQYVRERELGLEDSLRLSAQVCEAVQYGHQRGVIRRWHPQSVRPGRREVVALCRHDLSSSRRIDTHLLYKPNEARISQPD